MMSRYGILKTIFVLVALSLIGLGLASQTKQEAYSHPADEEAQQTAVKNIRLGATILGDNAFPQTIKKLLIREAENKGIELLVYDAEGNNKEQARQIRSMIAQQVDAIILNPVDANGVVEAVEEAIHAGIPVITVNAVVNSDRIASYVGSNDIEAGEMEARYIAEMLRGEGNIVILNGITGQSTQVQRTLGIKTALQLFPNIHILDEKSGNWKYEEGYRLMKQWDLEFGDKINGVISQNDEMALGAIQYWKEVGKAAKIPIVGIDGQEAGLAAVDRGELTATVFQDAVGQAKLALDLALKVIKEEKIAKSYFIPFRLVTKENTSYYLHLLSDYALESL